MAFGAGLSCEQRLKRVTNGLEKQMEGHSDSYLNDKLNTWTLFIIETLGECNQCTTDDFDPSKCPLFSSKGQNWERLGALFAVEKNPPFPLCKFCTIGLSKIRRALEVQKLRHPELIQQVLSMFGTEENICQRLFPGPCTPDFPSFQVEGSPRDLSGIGVCLECNLCKTAMMVAQIAFLNNPAVTEYLKNETKNGLCNQLPANLTLGINLQKLCKEFSDDIVTGVLNTLHIFFDPVNFCTTELHACNATTPVDLTQCMREACPSTSECIKELCKLILPDTATKYCNHLPF
jgi:hypothetical protein